MALTNYLTQSLIASTLFYGYGLGWYDAVGPFGLIVLMVAIYIAQLFFSWWWLNRYRFGPMEWIWRSLTDGKWQPLRQTTPLAPQPATSTD